MKIKLKYIPSLLLILATVFAGVALVSPVAKATNPDSADAVVNVNDACGFDADFGYTFNQSLSNGTAWDTEGIARTATTAGDKEVTLTCNNISGFSITAVGFSSDATHPTDNTSMFMSGGTATSPVIPTGAGTTTGTIPSSTASFWGMKVQTRPTPPATVSPTKGSNGETVTAAYATADHTFVAVPSSPTVVVHYNGDTSPVTATFRADYGVYVSDSQPAGTYTGKVKYTVVPD